MTETKLSKQEKAILKLLWRAENPIPGISYISREIAEQFDNDGSRIYVFKKQERLKELQEDLSQAKEEGDETGVKMSALALFIVGNRKTPKERRLNESHRASVSRSVRRLEDRDLIKRYRLMDYDKDKDRLVGTGKTSGVELTDYGKKVCSELFQ